MSIEQPEEVTLVRSSNGHNGYWIKTKEQDRCYTQRGQLYIPLRLLDKPFTVIEICQ